MSTEDEEYFEELLDKLSNIDSRENMKLFLEEILTTKEISEIPKRLQIFKMLNNGVPQREIAKKLGVGIATVTRGARVISERKK